MAEEATNTEAQKTELPPQPDVIVELEPGTPPAGVSTAGEKKANEAVADLATQYKEMEDAAKKAKDDLAEANARAARAEEAEQAAQREIESARAAMNSSNLDTINTALASAQADIDRAKEAIRTAKLNNDVDAEVDALDRLATAKTLVQRYDEARADLEARQRAAPKTAQPAELDPVEAYVRNRTAPTAKWLREHKDFIVDKSKNSRLTAAHYNALADNIAPDTKEYFEHVEKFLGIGGAEKKPDAKPSKPSSQRPVAPVTPSAGGSGQTANEVRLSAGEAKAATDGTHVWNYDDPTGQKRFKKGDPIGIQEFARRKQKLSQDGAYDRTYETQ